MMSKVAFSPTFMVVTPSSQPVTYGQLPAPTPVSRGRIGRVPFMTSPTPIVHWKAPRPTEESNLGEGIVSSGNRPVEPRRGGRMSILVAFAVRLGGVLQVASVLNGDLVALHRYGARAFLRDGLGNTHCSCGSGKVALRCGCEGSGRGSERIGREEHIYRAEGSHKIRPK